VPPAASLATPVVVMSATTSTWYPKPRQRSRSQVTRPRTWVPRPTTRDAKIRGHKAKDLGPKAKDSRCQGQRAQGQGLVMSRSDGTRPRM